MTVMQRGLAGSERRADALPLLHLDSDLLASREQIVVGEGISVRHCPEFVAPGHEMHAAGLQRGGRKGEPGSHLLGIVQPPIGEVLVPGDDMGGSSAP